MFATAAAVLALGLAGCGSDDDEETAAGDVTATATATATPPTEEPTPTATAEPTDEPVSELRDPSSYTVFERLEVDPGGEDVVLENSVIRGERDAYVVDPAEFGTGQQLNLEISSLEDNAVFDVYGPDDTLLEQESTQATIDLVQGGDHLIVVGGTRGNATYELKVNISVDAG